MCSKREVEKSNGIPMHAYMLWRLFSDLGVMAEYRLQGARSIHQEDMLV